MDPERLKKAYRMGYDQGMSDALELLATHLKDLRVELMKKFKEAGYAQD